MCFCTTDDPAAGGVATGFEPQGTVAGEAGTCGQAMNVLSSAIGGFISLFILISCFVPCLCFPWVYRAEDRLQTHFIVPFLDTYQVEYHRRMTIMAEEEAAKLQKEGHKACWEPSYLLLSPSDPNRTRLSLPRLTLTCFS